MKKIKEFGSELSSSQHSYSSNDDRSWSQEERQRLTDFFALLLEIDQQTNVTKVYADEETDK